MNTENVVKNLRVLWRTDSIIADIRMRHLLVGLGLRALAALIAAFGLLMLELSAYFALVQIWSAISAAAILGAVNFMIAAILFAIAARPPSGRELELANEIHDSSVDALQLEARALQSQLSGMIHHPLNGILPLLIVPLLTIIIKSLKKPAAAPRGGGRGRAEMIVGGAIGLRLANQERAIPTEFDTRVDSVRHAPIQALSIQSVSFTSQMWCSTRSVFTSKPRLRHISSMTVFS